MAFGSRSFQKKAPKYGNQKVNLQGYSVASKLEAAVLSMLLLRVRAGEITNLKTQSSVYLTRARILYKPDFEYEENGKLFYAEAKGKFETPEWRLKRRLYIHYGPAPLIVYKGTYKRFWLEETIIPKGENE